MFIGIGIGLLGYITFGDTIQSMIIYNLPYNDTVSIIAKMSYILTISGSFVIVIQPLFQIIEKSEAYTKFPKRFANKPPPQQLERSMDTEHLLNYEGPAVPVLRPSGPPPPFQLSEQSYEEEEPVNQNVMSA